LSGGQVGGLFGRKWTTASTVSPASGCILISRMKWCAFYCFQFHLFKCFGQGGNSRHLEEIVGLSFFDGLDTNGNEQEQKP
jgi:hypothetical protein